MATLAQWIHVSAAVIGVGGIAFYLFVLRPSLETLEDEPRALLTGTAHKRFCWIIWSAILLLTASGIYNVHLVWYVAWGRYWEFLALKIGLALIVFAIAFCLTVPLGIFERFRSRRDLWLSIAFGLAIAVILISAYLRRG